MEGKLYVLLGRSAVGKSTIEKMLQQDGFKRVISYTTRPLRGNEMEGVDYYYISTEKFQQMIAEGLMYEYTEYRGWLYGVGVDSIDLSLGNHILVTEGKGFLQLVEKLGKDKVIGIYLYLTDLWELLKRSMERQPHASEENCKEICRRFLSDFDTFKDVEKYCILKINNIDARETANIIMRNIKNKSI